MACILGWEIARLILSGEKARRFSVRFKMMVGLHCESDGKFQLLQGISVGDEMGFDSGLFDSDCN
jgi:hypothetical protein